VAPLWRCGARHDANFFFWISKKGKVPLTKYCGNVKKETPKIKKNSRDDLKKEMVYKQIKTYDKKCAKIVQIIRRCGIILQNGKETAKWKNSKS